jgi:hypothetical protein
MWQPRREGADVTTTQAFTSQLGRADHATQDDPPALWHYLSPEAFPATRDDLQAALVRHHAPARLLWELTCLSSSRRYDNLDQVCEALERPARPALPREPI